MTNRNRGDNKDRRPKGPQPHPVFTSVGVREEKIETKVEIFNFTTERQLRFSLNDHFVISVGTKDRKAEYTFEIPPSTTAAKIKVEVVGLKNAFDELILDIPQLAKVAGKKKDGPRLEIMTVRHTEDSICAILARLNPEGQPAPGRICYIDEEARIESAETDSTGIATISFPKRDKERRVWFFLPENIGNKTPLNISAIESKEKDANTKNKGFNGSFAEKWQTGFTAGKEFYKSLKKGEKK